MIIILDVTDANANRVESYNDGETLLVTPNGMQGFTTSLASPNVDLTNLHIDAGGIPGAILNILHLDSAIQYVVEKGAELAMGPIVNSAFGALAGPKKLNVLGKTIDIQVEPTDLSFDSLKLSAGNIRVH